MVKGIQIFINFLKDLVNSMLKIKEKLNGVFFDVSFQDKINILRGPSGSGKTFLFNTISAYCYTKGISYAFIDYRFLASNDEGLILSHCIGKDILLFDNADLYMSSELFNEVRKLGSTIIMSIKNTYGLNMSEARSYRVMYEGNSLKTRRF